MRVSNVHSSLTLVCFGFLPLGGFGGGVFASIVGYGSVQGATLEGFDVRGLSNVASGKGVSPPPPHLDM